MSVTPSYCGRPVLVSGAAGFVGANVCAALTAEGAEVHALVRPGSAWWRLEETPGAEIHEVDLLDAAVVIRTLTALRPEIIFHMAAYSAYHSQPDEQMRIRVDVGCTQALLQGASEARCRRFVHAGSSLEHGPSNRPFMEDDPLRPVTHRGVTKAAATLAVLRDAWADGRPNVVLRVFSVYGSWEHPHRLIPSGVRAALAGTVLPLTRPGLRRDFVFAEDVADAFLRAGVESAAHGELINIGSGEQWSNEAVVDLLEKATSKRIRCQVDAYPARPSDAESWVADIGKARRLLGWRPVTSLPQGLALTASWWRARPTLLDLET